ncbi:ATP-binding protein [Marinobacterium mangrovicola]|uniref:histidine kinase n=1 Tax=Marinobacterium mangrovicola TaxID=1476959 RepID=A0A4R1GFX5_9GAMM|nr:ATP-binding protein [Marinobacterium mangrovicola]TCK06918.1 two-component system sensor histidine kinase RegB [Marinobacterium mangrovicola]
MPGYHETLLQLTYTRVLILFGLSTLVLAAIYVVGAGVDVWLICATLGMMALINLFTYARLHSNWPVTESELFSQLCADAILYGALIYQTGGATNPFIFLLLVPLLISAATLSWRFTWLMAVIVVLFYSSLLRYYLPVLPPQTEHHFSLGALFDLHIIGMWMNFLLTVLLITWFLVRMQHSMRQQERRLNRERERRIRGQQMVSLATFAAGTAHELGTPLSTMSVILKDMALTHKDDPETAEDIALLQQQVSACSDRLQTMARSARDADVTHEKPMKVLLDELLDEWQIIRPQAQYQRRDTQPGNSPLVATSPQLKQALTNLLNNAADASEEPLDIELDWDKSNVWLRIHDQGPGLPLSSSANLGRPFVTTKGKGLGIGLFLTATTLAQHEGEVRLYDHPKGGTLTEVRLPTAGSGHKEAE